MVKYSTLSDKQLLVLLKDRDHRAFTEIYQRYWHVLFLHSYKFLQDKDAAQDVIQDLFTSLWNNSNLVISISLKAYLYTITRNHTLNIISREKVKRRYMGSLSLYVEQDSSFTEEQVRYNELVSLIEDEVSKLPTKMQEVFKKSRNEGLTHKVIAAELGISENTVKSTINRALKVMRSKLASLFFLFV